MQNSFFLGNLNSKAPNLPGLRQKRKTLVEERAQIDFSTFNFIYFQTFGCILISQSHEDRRPPRPGRAPFLLLFNKKHGAMPGDGRCRAGYSLLSGRPEPAIRGLGGRRCAEFCLGTTRGFELDHGARPNRHDHGNEDLYTHCQWSAGQFDFEWRF